MSVGFSQLAGGWQINGRGTIYATKALAEAAEKKGAAPNITYGDDAEFKAATLAPSTVQRPKLTADEEAAAKLESMKRVLDRLPKTATAPRAAAQRAIDALLKANPKLKKAEDARVAAELAAKARENANRNAAQYTLQRAKENQATQAISNAAKTHEAKTDWGSIPAFAGVLAGGAAIIATGGVAAGALAGGVSATSAVTAGVAVAGAVKGAQELLEGKPSSLAVPGLAGDAAALVGTAIAADKLIAAAESGGELAERAGEVFAATKELAAAGNVDANVALGVLAKAAEDRIALAIPAGVPQELTAKGEAALADFMALPKLTSDRPPALASSAPSVQEQNKLIIEEKRARASAEGTRYVRGTLVLLDSGRLDLSSSAWRSTTAGIVGARHGLIVDETGRLQFDEYWLAQEVV